MAEIDCGHHLSRFKHAYFVSVTFKNSGVVRNVDRYKSMLRAKEPREFVRKD